MSNTKRDRDRLRTQVERLKAENDVLRRATGWIDTTYLAVLVDLADIAIHPVRRPADLGGPINMGHAATRPPSPQPNTAYDLLRRERTSQRLAASLLRAKYQRIIDGLNANEAPTRSIHPEHDALSA